MGNTRLDPSSVIRLQQAMYAEMDRLIAAAVVEAGLLLSEEVEALRRDTDPGTLGDALVRNGVLGSRQYEEILREASLREILEVASPRSVPPDVAAAREDILKRVGKYILVARLGEGGMGEVWKAWDNPVGRWVALKILRGRDPQELIRFAREAHLAAQLDHPGVTRVFEVRAQPKKPYLALQFVEGHSLEGFCRLPTRAAEIVRDAARAVQHAHDRGIVHRDLKPANLLESYDGRVFVTDFGLARSVEGGGTITATGTLVGTPSFMSPEQARGESAGALSDVYSLGATLYALVVGVPPFVGESAYEILQRIAMGPIPAIPGKDDLPAIARKAMERDPRDRYPSAAALADDLDRHLSGRPIVARPPGATRRVVRSIRKRPRLALALLLGGLGMTALLAWGGSRLLRDAQRNRADVKSRIEIERARRSLADLQSLLSQEEVDDAMLEKTLQELEVSTRRALAHTPRASSALYYRGIALEYLGKPIEARALYERILSTAPDHADTRARRGISLFVAGWLRRLTLTVAEGGNLVYDPVPTEAILAASKDLNALPSSHPDYDYGQGLLAVSSGEFAKARRLLGELLLRRPYLLDGLVALAVTHLARGEYARAEKTASRLLGLRREDALALGTRAYARALRKDHDGAVADALDAVRLRPGWRSLRRSLARWLLRLDRRKETRVQLDILLRAMPDDPELRRLREECRADD